MNISGILDIRDYKDFASYKNNKIHIEDEIIKKIIHTMRMIKTSEEIEKYRKPPPLRMKYTMILFKKYILECMNMK